MEILLDLLKWSAAVGGATLILTLLKPLLDRRYSAKWRYGAWLVMAALLLLAPVQWDAFLPRAPVAPPVVIEVPKVEVSVSQQEGLTLRQPAPPSHAAAKADSGGEQEPGGERHAVFPLERVLTGLWLAGAGLFLLCNLAGTRRFARRVRRWSRPAGEDVLQVYQSVRREMGLKKVPPLAVSTAVDSPMVIGLLRPRLLLPEEGYGPRELAFILRHELTHYRRHDLWYKLVLLAAEGLHWFNPLIWLLRREAERDLELTCDDAVVAGADGETRRAYSETLLASLRRQRERAVLSTHFYGGKSVMKERFRNILGKRGRKRGAAVLTMAVLVTVGAACAFGVKAVSNGTLSSEELADWQTRLENPEMERFLRRMYTDPSYLPSEEAWNDMFPSGETNLSALLAQGYVYYGGEFPPDGENFVQAEINPKVLSGTRNGDTVTLEVEGHFASNLPVGTLTLVNGEPVSFTTPLYTAAEESARELMDSAAEDCISDAAENGRGALAFPEKYITYLICSQSITFDNKTYYIWNLSYRMRPDDMSKVMLAGGMGDENGWLTEETSMGSPILILSADGDGETALEERTHDTLMARERWTWEEYVLCKLHMGLNGMDDGALVGWPLRDVSSRTFLAGLSIGGQQWSQNWEDTARAYLYRWYGLTPEGGFDLLRTFQADETENSHDQAVLVQTTCEGRAVTLLLAHVAYPTADWNMTFRFWQVCGADPALSELAGEPPADFDPFAPISLSEPSGGAGDGAGEPSETGGTGGTGGAEAPESDPNIGPVTGIIGDFDGDGEPDADFLANYTKRTDLTPDYPVYLPNDPDSGYTPFLIDPSTGVPVYIFGSLPTGVTAEPVPEPVFRTSTPAVIGDYDHDGARDVEVEINGRVYPLTWDPETNFFAPIPGVSWPPDFDGDGEIDSEVTVNGQRYLITQEEDGIRYSPAG